MKRIILSVLLALSCNVIAGEINCRDAVVAGYAALKQEIDRDSFSQGEFEDFDLTPEQYNALSSEQQVVIYQHIKPLVVMVEETITRLNQSIERIVGTFYELYMTDDLQRWRAGRDQLRSCIYQD